MNILMWDLHTNLSDHPINESEFDHIIFLKKYSNLESMHKTYLLSYIEAHDDKIKESYLKLIYDLGNVNIYNKTLAEYLKLDNNFSFWWLTLITEKCNIGKSANILSAIKVIAINKVILSQQEQLKKNVESISIYSDDKDIIKSLKRYSHENKYDFFSQLTKLSNTPISTKVKLKKYLPNFFLSIAWLINRIIKYLPLKGVGLNEWTNSKASLTFGSYLFNIDAQKLKNNIFYSAYWTTFSEKLTLNKIKSNWIHVFVPDKDIPNAGLAKIAIKKLNDHNEAHTTTDSFTSITLILKTIFNYFIIYYKFFFIKGTLNKNLGYLYPLLKDDVHKSFKGISAISNLYYFFLYQKAFSMLPQQNVSIYLLENQGWEACFNGAYKSYDHLGPVIGIPHSTIRYWDLRYFNFKQIYKEPSSYFYSSPDLIGVNGPYAKESLLRGGYPSESIIELEALRYLDNLEDISKIENKKNDLNSINMLILGDYSFNKTNQQIKLLEKAYKKTQQNIKFFIKPHPACPINIDAYELKLELVSDSLDHLLNESDLVYTSNTTSAAVDAFCRGVPIITYLDNNDFNLSPLRGSGDVSFVSSSFDLTNILNSSSKKIGNVYKDYFYSETSLSRWMNCLKEHEG